MTSSATVLVVAVLLVLFGGVFAAADAAISTASVARAEGLEEESRTTRCGCTVEAGDAGPSGCWILAISRSAAILPMSRMGKRTVVSEGQMRDASGASS